MEKKMRNPLHKRIPKELRGDWRKYLIVSLFLILVIGFVSGMYVANESMMTATTTGKTAYKLEDGHFELDEKADEALLAAICSGEKAEMPYESDDPDFRPVPVHVDENFFRNADEDHDNDGKQDGTVRVYTKTEEINLACLMDGRFPEADDEIAIDRMHADNVGVKVGDEITVGEARYRIVGLLAYVNYSTLHEKSSDMMFDALKFNVAMVTQGGFDRLQSDVHYAYAWHYDTPVADEKQEKVQSDDFLSALLTQTIAHENELTDYLPAYRNPAIHFASEDMGGDMAMGGVLLDIFIVIIAFIFAVTISNTISREAKTIGTLRASGYTRGELVRHYLAMPVIVTLFSAAAGNVLGYTVFKNVVVSMYYNSYSLPTYETLWNLDALIKTTCIPVALMFVVNLAVLTKKMRQTPLEFLRGELKQNKRKKAMRLPDWNFFSRFRLRIIFQNLSNYLVLFCGIFFIMVMLAMAVGMPNTLDYYKENAESMMLSKYQYVLKSQTDEGGEIITTENEDAERFCMRSLQKRATPWTRRSRCTGSQRTANILKLKICLLCRKGRPTFRLLSGKSMICRSVTA